MTGESIEKTMDTDGAKKNVDNKEVESKRLNGCFGMGLKN